MFIFNLITAWCDLIGAVTNAHFGCHFDEKRHFRLFSSRHWKNLFSFNLFRSAIDFDFKFGAEKVAQIRLAR